jgi:hypothetical protein
MCSRRRFLHPPTSPARRASSRCRSRRRCKFDDVLLARLPGRRELWLSPRSPSRPSDREEKGEHVDASLGHIVCAQLHAGITSFQLLVPDCRSVEGLFASPRSNQGR